MAGKYKFLTLSDRMEIERAYSGGDDAATIAAALESTPSTIYRELRRGYTGETDANGRPAYSAEKAQGALNENVKKRGRPFAR